MFQMPNKASFHSIFLHLVALQFIFQKSHVITQSIQLNSENLQTTGVYITNDNPFCTKFVNDACNQCASTYDYYLYGNQCVKFQNRQSDYVLDGNILRVCDDLCDSDNCVETAPNTGLCTGCKYSSESFELFGYQTPSDSSGQELFERCITDCDHFGQVYSNITNRGTGICKSCADGCENCISDTLCIECSYSYQRYTGTSSSRLSDEVFKENSPPQSCNTRPLRTIKEDLESSGMYNRDYYVTPREWSSSPCSVSTCEGTYQNPFDDINLVFEHLLDVFFLGQKEEAEVNIYLMKGQSSSSSVYEHFWGEKDIPQHYKRVFERTAVDVKIQPLTCDGASVTTGCYNSNEKANVVLKSNKISFFVTKTFTFRNIILDASELIPDSSCYRENQNTFTRCCTDNEGTYPLKSNIILSNGQANDAQCEPSKSSSGNSFLSVPWEAYSPTQDLWKKGPFAFFVMNFLRDYPKYIPTLKIEGCTFKNFWYHRYAYSFIYLDQRASKLTITDSKFQNSYFPMGFITNMQKFTQRNSFFTINLISTKYNNCTTYNSSLSDCHSLTLQDSTFQDAFFGDYTFQATNTDYYHNEGIVLSLQEFRGPILVKNNNFQRLSSIKFSLVDGQGSTDEVNAKCSTPRFNFETKYGMSLDRHMQVVIGHEEWLKKPRSSSVLSIRNVTHGVTLYKNTFTNNAAETGTGLFIHNFENTESKPIVIEENNFNGNFATEFGTALAIIKYERDYVNLACKGVYISKNTFQDNFGCPYVRGTVIVSCMPEKPKVSSMNLAYSDKESTDLLAYILSSFVSVNDVNSFKNLDDDQTGSRFEDMIANEYDNVTAEVFSRFVQDITRYKNETNATAHPIYGTQIDTNRITSIGNTFKSNYAYHSHLFLQGAYNTLVQETVFEDNSVPVPQLLPEYLTKNIAHFKKALGLVSYWFAIETTPLMIRMSNYIVVEDSSFINNRQLLYESGSLVFGAAITLDKHLGMSDVLITNCSFEDNQGWTSSNVFDNVNGTITDEIVATQLEYAFKEGVQGTLITYNYWEYMYGIQVYESEDKVPRNIDKYYDIKSAIPNLILNSCTFSNNIFAVPSGSQVDTSTSWAHDYRTALIRRYTGIEGMGLKELPSSDYINSYGTFVFYAEVIYEECSFISNTIKDQRTFINPYGFNSLTINNSEFDSNVIVDEKDYYYSLRSYLYSYHQKESKASLVAENLTFKKNTGKLVYFEEEATQGSTESDSSYQITLNNITITGHISSPDFLIHIVNKQNITFTLIEATEVSSSLGFMYLDTPGANVEISSVSVNGLTSSKVGCLYVKSMQESISLGDFLCQGAVIQEVNSKSQTIIKNSVFEARKLLKEKDTILVSACFAFYDRKELSISNLQCISAVLKGAVSPSQPNPESDQAKGVCLYTRQVNKLTISNFKCILGSMENFSKSKDKAAIAYLRDLETLSLTSLTFEDNIGERPLYLDGGQVKITGSTFSNNTAKTAGSAIYGENSIGLVIKDTYFSENTCDGCSGTVNVQNGKLVMTNSTFLSNIAETAGCIFASLATVIISESTFKWNGAETLASVLNADLSTSTVSSSTFEENYVQSGEATAYFYGKSATLKDNTFKKNKATRGSRNIQVLEGSNIEIDNCTFIENEEDNDNLVSIKGSFILVRNTEGVIKRSTFLNGKGGYGGAIYFDLKLKKNFAIKDSTFKGCQAGSQGEALYIKGIQYSSVKIQDVYFSCGTSSDVAKNRKTLYAVYCELVTCYLTNTTFNPLYAEVDTGNQLYLYKGSSHLLNQVTFSSDCDTTKICKRDESSALKIEEVTSVNVIDSVFLGWGDKSSSLGGAVRIEFSEGKNQVGGSYNFSNCIWRKNQALSGGAIYAKGLMKIYLMNSEFSNNEVVYDGGAIYWDSSSTKSDFIIQGTGLFTGNTAGGKGGGYYFEARKIDSTNALLSFTDNQAEYGANRAGYSVFLKILEDPDPSLYEGSTSNTSTRRLEEPSTQRSNRFLTSEVYASGSNIYPPIVLTLHDEFKQHVTTDSVSIVEVSAIDPYGNTAETEAKSFQASKGYVILSPLKVYSQPGASVTFKFNLTSFKPESLGRSAVEFSSFQFPTQEMFLRECLNGERLSDNNVCTPCDPGYYTFVFNSTQKCTACPEGGVCLGFDEFGPDVNYFRLSYSTNAVVACSNDDACRGATVLESEIESLYCKQLKDGTPTFCYTGWCEAGYQGNLCAECQDGYAYRNTETKTCTKCSDNPSYYLISVGLGVAGILYLIIMIRSTIKAEKPAPKSNAKNAVYPEPTIVELKKEETLNKSDLYFTKKDDSPTLGSRYQNDMSQLNFSTSPESNQNDAEELSLTSIYMKILTNYIQIVAIVGTFSFEWPDEITNLFSSQEKIAKSASEIFSFDCLLRQSAFQNLGLSSFFSKLMIMALSPIGLSIIIILIWYLIYITKYRRNMKNHKEKLKTSIITSLVVTLFILHPTIVELSTQAFKCVQLGDNDDEVYLEANLEVRCWGSSHLKWAFLIGMPSLFIWGFGIPLWIIYVLWSYRNTLHLDSMKAKYGFLYEGFSPKAYYWEFIIFYRKMILIFLSVFLTNYTTVQGAIVIGVSCWCYVMQNRVQPYLTDTLNEMEARSLISSGLTVYAGLFYLTDDLSSGVKIFFLVIIILANVYFSLYFTVEFLRAKADELLQIKIIEKIFGRCLRAMVNFKWKNSLMTKKVTSTTYPSPAKVFPFDDKKVYSSNPTVSFLDKSSSSNIGLKEPPNKERIKKLAINTQIYKSNLDTAANQHHISLEAESIPKAASSREFTIKDDLRVESYRDPKLDLFRKRNEKDLREVLGDEDNNIRNEIEFIRDETPTNLLRPFSSYRRDLRAEERIKLTISLPSNQEENKKISLVDFYDKDNNTIDKLKSLNKFKQEKDCSINQLNLTHNEEAMQEKVKLFGKEEDNKNDHIPQNQSNNKDDSFAESFKRRIVTEKDLDKGNSIPEIVVKSENFE